MTDDQRSDLRALQPEVSTMHTRLQSSDHRVLPLRRRGWRNTFRATLWTYRQYDPRPLDCPHSYRKQRLPDNPPRIAIVTPSFNQVRFLRQTIDSVLGQNYPMLDYIVQDADSSDGTKEVLRSYDGRIGWRSEKDDGQSDGINRGFASVSGEIMAYLNSDDLLLPGALAYVAQVFRKNPAIDFIYGNRITIDRDGKEIGRIVLPRHDRDTLTWADYIPQETMFWRRTVWQATGPFDPTFRFAMDWDFILRAQAAGFRFRRVPRFIGCFRIHPEQKTTAWEDIGRQEQMRLRRMHLGFLPTQKDVSRRVRPYLRRQAFYQALYNLRVCGRQ